MERTRDTRPGPPAIAVRPRASAPGRGRRCPGCGGTYDPADPDRHSGRRRHRKYAADGADAAPHGPAHLPRATAARPGRATRDRSGGTPALRGTAVPPREPDPDG